jgi:hypothetical protein
MWWRGGGRGGGKWACRRLQLQVAGMLGWWWGVNAVVVRMGNGVYTCVLCCVSVSGQCVMLCAKYVDMCVMLCVSRWVVRGYSPYVGRQGVQPTYKHDV